MLAIGAFFTKNAGEPATGLTLSDIDLYLTSINRSSGAVTVIWDGTQHPTDEITNIGGYFRAYVGENLGVYVYYARASYTGATLLDTNHVIGAIGPEPFPAGAVEYDYVVIDSTTLLPVEGADVWVTRTTDSETIWRGVSDVNGYARDVYDRKPLLDPGTYYFYKQLPGYIDDDNPDTEVVS